MSPLSNIEIRAATSSDLPAIVRVHLGAFPGFYLSDLGPAFLHAYYKLILKYQGGCILVAVSDGSIIGFVAGFCDPTRFYRRMAANRWRFIFPVAWGVLRNARLLVRTVRNVFRVRSTSRNPLADASTSCELSSLAVAPNCARAGLGKRLVESLAAEVKNLGMTKIYLTTDAENNEAVNRFYERVGFTAEETHERDGGRIMRKYERLLCDGPGEPSESTIAGSSIS